MSHDDEERNDAYGNKRLNDYYDAWVQSATEASKWEGRFYGLLGVLIVVGLATNPKLTLAIAGIAFVVELIRGKLQDRRTTRWLEEERKRAERQQQDNDASM
ncbi:MULTISPECIES: hypothetical protein [Burkholderia cepacia complex]|uniref:hypothetical protein n=1 Tax=Burkholderia cepacia complex TaxID=87882 RepID=UPI00157A86D2|nr:MULTISPECIES: hypothetical protein [Burkholderia cepacia complex]NTY36475.1 hypothetical protein [Burkholderia diffusa]